MLVVLTIVVIFQVAHQPGPTTGTASPGDSSTAATVTAASRASLPTSAAANPINSAADPPATVATETPAAGAPVEARAPAAAAPGSLPDGPAFVPAGAGTWHVVAGATPTVGTGERHVTYTVEVEDGLEPPEADQEFAAAVDATLADPRSWIGGGQVSMTRVDSGEPDFRVSLTSQMTIRAPDKCGWEVQQEASCYNGWAGRVMINDARWVRGAVAYNGDLNSYRAYAVNHEVGHALGNRHEPCPENGAPAPVMMQQSWGVANDDLNVLDPQLIPRDGKVCLPNPYPFPAAAVPAAPAVAASAVAG